MKTVLELDHRKAIQAINFFARKEGGKIDKLKVIKLIWLADRRHLRKYGRPIINDTYYAMEYGPVGSSIKDFTSFNMLTKNTETDYLSKYLKQNNNNKIESINEPNMDVFSDSDINTLETVYNEYGKLNGFKLVEISHEYPEWKKFKKVLESKSSTREVMNYKDFFLNPKKTSEKKVLQDDEKTLSNSKKIFEENFQLASYWI